MPVQGQTTPGKDIGFEEEMEELHLSRFVNLIEVNVKNEELYFFCFKRRMICISSYQVVFRKDNPYLSSCEALDSEDFGDEVVVLFIHPLN